MRRRAGFWWVVVLGVAHMHGVAEARRLADISLTGRDVTSSVSPGEMVSGSVSGRWWTESGSEGALWYVVAGFRNERGSWVGGEPVPVAGMGGAALPLYPGRSFSDKAFAGLTAPTDCGTYTVWIQMVPVTSLSRAIRAFKSHAATTERQYHKRVGAVAIHSPASSGTLIGLRDGVRSGAINVEVVGTGTDACFGLCMVV